VQREHGDISRQPSTAVVLPCLNEAPAIAGVIAGFAAALPSARIYVIDNASTDATAETARKAGAIVIHEPQRGKGNAVRRAFAAIDADIFVIADGDGTYVAARAPELIATLQAEHLDMVVGARRKTADEAYRAGHEIGNWAFNRALKASFGSAFRDIFSGYRVLSRRFVKSFPAMSDGFEIETEMSVHAILLRMPTREIDCDYHARPAGTASKLKTVRDGFRILGTLFNLVRLHRPLIFFTVLAGFLLGSALALFVPVFLTFLETGLVPRIPTLIVAAVIGLAGLLAAFCGLILDASARTQVEIRRLLYLNAAQAAYRSVETAANDRR
jgi:glycosyltransferase involved in cell wall biosynthesis